MEIAIISDIHANHLAFDNAIEAIEKSNPDKIFCLGDIFMAGIDPNLMGERIFNLKEKYKDNFEIIQGNTDKMIALYSEELFSKVEAVAPHMAHSLKEDVKMLDKKYVDFIANLDEKKTVEINGLKIELVHGSPRRQDENIYPTLSPDEVEEMVQDSSADLIFCGHTHIPCGYSLNSGKTVVNVGSIGRSMTEDKMPYWAILKINNKDDYHIEHRTVKYDNKMASEFILKRAFKHCEDLAKMYI